MPVVRLNRRTLATLPIIARPTIFFDEELKGFGLRAMPSGSRSWIIEYRPDGGGRGVSKKRLTLGSMSTLSPEEARREARRLLASVELGEDPAGDRSTSRKAGTVSEVVAAYMGEIRATKKPRTAVTFDSYVKVHIEPALGSRKAESITRADVVKLHRSIGRDHQVTANRVLTLLGTVFTYAAKADLLPKDFVNPVRDIEKYREEGRERYLSMEEIGSLGDTLRLAETDGLPWSADKKLRGGPRAEHRKVVIDPFAVAALRLLLLTGCRLREILHLRWSEVDLQRGLLLLADSKTGRKPVVLGAPAMVILAGLPRVGTYVIPGYTRVAEVGGEAAGGEKPRSDLHKPWTRIATHAGLGGVRIHDLRHSFASVGAGSGLGLQVIGRLLGHSRPETTSRYAHLADHPLRHASDSISGSIAAALAGQEPADIMAMRKTHVG